MMQLVLLAMVLGIFARDSGQLPTLAEPPRWPVLLAVVLLPKLLIAAAYWAACARGYTRLARQGSRKSMRRLDLLGASLPFLAITSFGVDLWAGLLGAVRGEPVDSPLGPRDVVLLDEVAVMLPTLALIAFGWWAYYPIDRAIRERGILGRADMGLPIYPLWTRGQYVGTQLRTQLGLVLGPLVLIMAWSELLLQFEVAGRITLAVRLWLMPVGSAAVFLTAPLLVRHLWDTVPLPPGGVRDKLEGMCRRHGVRVRQLLLWRTHGGVINAAVMGLFGPIRYVMLTDGLLDQVEEERVEAVMAHELGHVKHKHLWWLLVHAAAIMLTLSWCGDVLLARFDEAGTLRQAAETTVVVLGLALWAAGFGWVSRRVERQADTFAARHMSRVWTEHAPPPPEAARRKPAAPPPETPPEAPSAPLPGAGAGAGADRGVFEAAGAAAMAGALQRVADLNHLPVARRSWRHGSIAWRQRYLRSLVQTPTTATPIDLLMRQLNLAAMALLVLNIAVIIVGPG